MDPQSVGLLLQHQRQLAEGLARWPLQLLGGVTAVGFLTMTIIEMFKIGMRCRFNRAAVAGWIGRDAAPGAAAGEAGNGAALKELVALSTAGDEAALFSLPIENLCGQVAAAAQAVLDAPAHHRQLLSCLAGRSTSQNRVGADIGELLSLAAAAEQGGRRGAAAARDAGQRYAVLRSRVAAHVQRNIDGLQISSALAWKKRVRNAAILWSFVIALVGSLLFTPWTNWLQIAVFSVLAGYSGGFVASILREAVGALERARK